MTTTTPAATSWKTWLGGGIAVLGILTPPIQAWVQTGTMPDFVHLIGPLLAALGIGAIGQYARDDNVSSDGTVAPKDVQPTRFLYDPTTGARIAPVEPPAPIPATVGVAPKPLYDSQTGAKLP